MCAPATYGCALRPRLCCAERNFPYSSDLLYSHRSSKKQRLLAHGHAIDKEKTDSYARGFGENVNVSAELRLTSFKYRAPNR